MKKSKRWLIAAAMIFAMTYSGLSQAGTSTRKAKTQEGSSWHTTTNISRYGDSNECGTRCKKYLTWDIPCPPFPANPSIDGVYGEIRTDTHYDYWYVWMKKSDYC
ncbi:MAG: hypothetical protein QNJ97_15130 [Myxococcota bacterium]|nr:hypothetical protein [Myxococcota bacterium]